MTKPTHQTALPFVGGIIEKTNAKGGKEFLIQIRFKPERDPVYSGTLEFPAGVLDQPYENVYKALAREIKEEAGLTLVSIKGDSQTKTYSPKGNDATFGFRPFCCLQQLKNGRPWIGFVFLCEVKDEEPKAQQGETKDVHWIKAAELKEIFYHSPEKLFTLEILALEYYFLMST